MSERKAAVFLDRDGVVNEVVFRDGHPASPRSLEEFVWAEGIQEAVKQLKAAALPVFVVTNQPDIRRGKLDPAVVEQITAAIYDTLPIDELRVCPHDNQDDCACRKPRPGMLTALAIDWQIDLSRSFMVGDSWKDMAAGQAAGCRTILLERDYNRGAQADFGVADVRSAADLIVQLVNG